MSFYACIKIFAFCASKKIYRGVVLKARVLISMASSVERKGAIEKIKRVQVDGLVGE